MTYLLFSFIFLIATVSGHQSRRYHDIIHVPRASGNDVAVVKDDVVRCFHYTWLADLDSLGFLPYENKTCFDKYASEKPMPLCVNPMVVTDNGNEPDSNWLVDHEFDAVTCRLSAGYTCAKYSYYFNGKVQNVTRYCTKISVEGSGSMESGCITADVGSYQTEVCACNKMLGNMPCNRALTLNSLTSIGMVMIFGILLNFIR